MYIWWISTTDQGFVSMCISRLDFTVRTVALLAKASHFLSNVCCCLQRVQLCSHSLLTDFIVIIRKYWSLPSVGRLFAIESSAVLWSRCVSICIISFCIVLGSCSAMALQVIVPVSLLSRFFSSLGNWFSWWTCLGSINKITASQVKGYIAYCKPYNQTHQTILVN